jgi:amidase
VRRYDRELVVMQGDAVGAFCPDDDVTIIGAPEGVLAGLRFAAKDLFDVAGHITGAGNPDWRRTHEPATRTSPVITALVDAGATLVGKTITDELAFSLLGVNAHYGTPVNPPAPDSIPGGSSSGSASATAAGLVDFAIGTDTGGSVRVPAALCGLYGFRPTHGAISLEHAFPLAPSFDTVGWFAREALVLWQLAQVLLVEVDGSAPIPTRILLPEDVWDAADEPVVDILLPEMQRLAMRYEMQQLEVLADEGLDQWAEHFRLLQGHEIWQEHGEWLESVNPTLSLDVKQRIDAARAVTDAEATRANAARDQIMARLRAMLDPTTVLAIPTTPEIAPLLESTDEEFADFRRRTLEFTCIAGLGGLPQVTVPVATLAEYPVGLSFIGGPGTDQQLIALAATVTRPAS